MAYGRCPFYYWDGYNWRCLHGTSACTFNEYVAYCTNPDRCRECYYYTHDYS